MSRKYLNAVWELTKRELKRKYVRSYLGILWSCLYPFMRMVLVVVLFTHIFDKGIPMYASYYFSAYLIFEFFNVGSSTSLTTLVDNKDLIQKTKLSRKTFIISRVNTAFINFLLGCIPFVIVLLYYRVKISFTMLMIIPVFAFLYLYVLGMSYIVAIIYVYFRDIKNIYFQIIFLWRYFVAMFYDINWVHPKVASFIDNNPMYVFIKISRDSVIYGTISDFKYFIQMIVYSVSLFLLGSYIFAKNKDLILIRV